jgi:hypothetical protein
MADTPRTAAELLALIYSNTSRAVGAQPFRDLIESVVPGMGRLSLLSEVQTTFPGGIGSWSQAAGVTILSPYSRHFVMEVNGQLKYTGTPDIHVHVAGTLSCSSPVNNQEIELRIAKNGQPTLDGDAIASRVDLKLGTGGAIETTAVHYDSMMSTGDYLAMHLSNETSTSTVTMRHLYLFILGMLSYEMG